MAMNYQYIYAEIEPDTGLCTGVFSGTVEHEETSSLVAIPVYDEEYIFKYYINGNWYEDAEGTILWQSSLI